MFVLRGRDCPVLSTPAVFLLAVWLVVVGGRIAARAAEVIATRLDGTTQSGKLRELDDKTAVIATAEKEHRIPVEQLMSLRWLAPTAGDKASHGTNGIAELTDGTLIPISGLGVRGKTAALMLAPAGNAKIKSIELPIAQLAAVRFQQFDESLAAQWDEIRQQKLASDLLVVHKRDGKSLDYVEGVLGEITDHTVEFKLEGETNRVDRAKVAGVIYYRNDRRPPAEPEMVLDGRSGLRASVLKARLADRGFVELTTTGGATFTWPVDDIEFADFSGSKIAYLSDLRPASRNWSPLVGLPTGLALAAEYGQPRRDRSAFGGKLSLVETSNPDDPSASPDARRSFDKGLALRSRTELVYRLPPGFSRFRAVAGIDPAASASGNVRLAIMADDHPLLETQIASEDGPLPIDVEIAGAKRLKIIVDFGQNQDSGDWLNLCDAKFVK